MALTLIKRLQNLRFLIVAALVFALLSSPFLSEAGSKQSSTVQVAEIADTIAGLSNEVKLSGGKYKTLEIAVEKPDGEVLLLEGVTDGQGSTTIVLSNYHLRQAGTYTVAAREQGENTSYGASKSFEVYAGTVSSTKSQIDLSKQSGALGETIELTVSLLDDYGNEIDGHVLKVIPDSEDVSVYSPEFASDENGHMNFYITSETKGIYEFTVFDSSINKTLTSTAKIAFSGSNTYSDRGGHDEDNESVYLSAESGEVSGFLIEGLEESVVVGDSQSITVKAIDSDGFTVPDYTGTIRFSSSDSSATLPNDYTFLAEDQGEHAFSLAVKFVTPGENTISVTDIEEFSLTGETTVEVITTEESGVDYDEDFETTDFTRDGDFTLISPASGYYSSDTVEVQGEAEYGYSAVLYLNEKEMGRTEVEFDNSFTLTVEDLADGTYELYVDIVELGDGEPGEEEILSIFESSDSESVTIDTTAPELVSISADPSEDLSTGDTVTLTVLSESELEEASILFEEEIYSMEETSTNGKYQVDLILPETAGSFTVDVLLMDNLGNEVQYRDQLTLSTAAVEPVEEPAEEPETTGVGGVTGLTATGTTETVLLSWEAAESEKSIAFYRVYYGPSSSALYAISETYDSSTSWSIMDLTGDEAYYFAVSAVDVEGTEGEQSEVVMAVPELGRTVEVVDTIDDTSPTPAISGTEEEIEENPETGPAQTMMLVLSALGALTYLKTRKRVAFENI